MKLKPALLSLTVAAALFAPAAETVPFKAGFSRVDITPAAGTPMSGYFGRRAMTGVLDPLEADCLALNDGTKTAFVFALDNLHLTGDVIAEVTAGIAKRTGVPAEGVFIHSSHIHTGPDANRAVGKTGSYYSADDLKAISRYVEFLMTRLVDAAQYAAEDLAPTTMRAARGTCPRQAFIRRYRMKDGKAATNPGFNNPDVVGPIGTPDDTVQVVRFVRTGKKEIVLVNFQNHPDVIGGSKISADWPGMVRRTLVAALGGTVECLFVNGAQGDTNHIILDPKPGEKVTDRYANAMNMGRMVAGAALQVWGRADPLPAGRIRYGIRSVTTVANRPKPEEMAQAHKYWALHMAGKNDEIPGTGMAKTTVIADARRKVRLEHGPDSFQLPVSAIAVGDALAFAGLPGEPFTKIGCDVKKGSPFAMTVFACLTNGSRGYFPTPDAYLEGGYEARTSDFTGAVAGDLTAGALSLLTALKAE